MTKPAVAVVDYGMGNRRSVEKAFEHVGARARITSDPTDLSAADGLVVPGVGAFPRAMENLRSLGLERTSAYEASRVGQSADVVVVRGGNERSALTEDYPEVSVPRRSRTVYEPASMSRSPTTKV